MSDWMKYDKDKDEVFVVIGSHLISCFGPVTICCYIVDVNLLLKVKSKLKGHSKRITGIAFSYVLNVLVSSGADSQVNDLYAWLSCSI